MPDLREGGVLQDPAQAERPAGITRIYGATVLTAEVYNFLYNFQ